MKKILEKLTRDSAIYGIGDIATKAVLFFLLPVYTRIFTPAEYGTLETLTIINTFLGVLLIMGMDGAQSFYFFEQKSFGKTAQAEVVSAILQWRLIWGSAIVVLVTFLSPLLNAFFFNGKLTLEYFIVSFVGTLFVQLMGQSAEVFRLLYRPAKYLAITLGYTAISAITSIILVIWLKLGIKGHFMGFCVGSIIGAIFGLRAIRDYLDFSKLHSQWWPKFIRFGAPLVPAALGMYALNTTDRWFIIHYHGQGTLGIYAVGAKFVIVILFIVNAFRQAWWPISMNALQSPDGHRLFRTVARLYLGLGIISIVVLTSLSPLLIELFTGNYYHSAYPIVAVLSWQALFYGFFMVIVAGIWKEKKTYWISIATAIAVLINIVLDLCFVPRFGGIGAAIATSISFLTWNIIIFIISQRLWFINYPLGIFSLQIGIGIVGCWRILFIYQNNLPTGHVVAVVIVVSIILFFTLVEYNKFIKTFRHMRIKLLGRNK